MTNLTATKAAKEIFAATIDEARRVVEEDEARLRRPLTDAEVGKIADMVVRQLKTALAMSR